MDISFENKLENGHIERIVPNISPQKYVDEHIERYNYAKGLMYGKTLDAACGVGYGSKILSEKCDKVIAVDYSQEAIDYASKHYGDPKISFECQDLDRWDIPIVDCVVSFETLEHLRDPQRFLQQVFDRSRLFVFSLPLNSPITEFHLRKFDNIDEVKQFIGKEFEYFIQKDVYVVGVWRK